MALILPCFQKSTAACEEIEALAPLPAKIILESFSFVFSANSSNESKFFSKDSLIINLI